MCSHLAVGPQLVQGWALGSKQRVYWWEECQA